MAGAMRGNTRPAAFTLIEVLVVVAIIALLISILLPSLTAAKEQARMVTCQSSIRQIAVAFVAWSSEHKGRLPGIRSQSDPNIGPLSWIGSYGGTPPQPEAGAVYRNMGRQKAAYICPSDEKLRFNKYPVTHSYSFQSLLSGASVEWLAGAHRLKNPAYDDLDHTGDIRPMVALEHVPLLVEEDFKYYDTSKPINTDTMFDGGWANDDGIADRHLRSGGKGWASMAFVDTHVGRVQLPHGSAAYPFGDSAQFFSAKDLCIRTQGKWISGRSYLSAVKSGGWGACLSLEPASAKQVRHVGDR